MPLEMRILLSAAALLSPPLPHVRQHTPTWIWSGAKQEQYTLALQAVLLLGQFATELYGCCFWRLAAGRGSLRHCTEDCSSDGWLAPNLP